MTTQTEALKLALEGVEIHSPNSPEYIVCASLIQALAQTKHNPVGFYDAENKDLRREIPMGEDGDWWQPVYTHPPVPTAQPEQEPVAWITQGGKGWLRWHKSYDDNKDSVPLYTTPPQRKPLTRGQIREIEVDVSLNPSFDYITPAEQLCRAIEAAHGIKGDA